MATIVDLKSADPHVRPTSFRNSSSQGITAVPARNLCSSCNLRAVCFPCALSENEMGGIEELIAVRRRVRRGETLYHTNEPFHSLFVVRTGSFKTRILTEDAREQVTGFQMVGEVLGMDGISNDVYTCDVLALEDSEVCAIRFSELERLSTQAHAFQRCLHRIMGREIVRDHNIMMLLGQMRSEEKLAAFLINLSQYFSSRGYSSSEFNLRMSREEIGSYLGLTLETVSRTLSKLQEDGLIEVHQKHIRIVDIVRLKCALDPR